MNILVVSQYFWPESFRVNDICLGLIEKGHKVTVLTGIPNYPEGQYYEGYGIFKNIRQNYKGIDIIRVPLTPRGKGNGWRLIANYLSFAVIATLLLPLLFRKDLDLIYVYQLSPVTMALPAVVLKKIKKIPLVHYVLDLWPESISATGINLPETILRFITKFVCLVYKSSDQILVSSRGFIFNISKMGIEQTKLKYWPQWAEELYQVEKAKDNVEEVYSMPQGFRVMFAGNIGVAQSFKTILGAAQRLREYPDIHWIILGDGRLKRWVEQQIEIHHLKENFHLFGRKPVESMPKYFSLADAMLLTLKKDSALSSTLPAKIQSYMACGRPILAGIDGEGASVIEEAGAGYTCPADNEKPLADIVLKMYNTDRLEREKMGLKGREYFEKNFKREVLLTQLDNWINDIHIKK